MVRYGTPLVGILQEGPHGQVAVPNPTAWHITFNAMQDTMLEQRQLVLHRDLAQGQDLTVIAADGVLPATLLQHAYLALLEHSQLYPH